ncbi:MAG TPA: ABC transporter substrate-binding protein [Candidatus Megamonas gallistercoris]|nr:ABC transporter substrate-binding protein [Candidatus Megamonas gallistercoris]
MNSTLRKLIFIVICLIAVGGAFLASRQENGASDRENEAITVTDSTGREVVIPAHPKRVVLLNASHLDLYYYAGGGETIVGKPTSEALSDEVKEGTKSVQEVGVIHNPSVETILNLQPDLVIGINVPFHQQLIPTLEKADIPVLIKSLDTYEDVLETLAFYGELTGRKDTAQAKIEEIKTDYKEAVTKAEGKNPPKSLMIWGTLDSFSMATSKSFAGNLVYRLGGNNIADSIDSVAKDNSGFIPLSMEYIATQNPEVIFIVTHGDPKAVKTELDNTLGANPLWQDVSAVKNGRVYVLPYQLFAVNPGTRIGEALNILADDLYE